MNYDVGIVGAGIVGAACAASLSASGLRVLMVEAGRTATGTTATGMGHIVLMDDTPAQLLLTGYSRRLWRVLAEQLPADSEFENCGTIWLAADDDEMAEVQRKNSIYASQGAETEILDSRSLRDLEPNIREGLAGGLLVKDDCVVYQLCATKFLIDRSARYGASIVDGTTVTAIGDGELTFSNGDSVSCGVTINAAGIAAASLTPELRIAKRKGHLAITERYPNFVRHQLIELGYLKSAHGSETASVAFNAQPRSTGQILLGSSRQFGEVSDRIDFDILRRMTSRAFEYVPGLRSLSTTRVWTGFRPSTPDNLPYIGAIPGRERTYAACGHEGLGITTSLATAELLTSLILGTKPAIPVEPYSPARSVTQL